MVRRASLAILGASVVLAHSPKVNRLHQLETRGVDMRGSPVIANLFEWTYPSVGAECTNFLGKAGYKYVLVSPASEHVTGGQWWTSYQRVSSKIQSKHGSREDFRNMVNACKGAGVQVLVDVIWNHMAGSDDGWGVAGTHFTHYAYDGIYSGWDFHYCGTQGNDIQDWNNEWQVRNCELSNLADLKTETEYVRKTLIDHGNDLLSLGVAGFRLDAAKHIPIEDLRYILERLTFWPYITSEVIGMANPTPATYTQIGATSVADYFQKLARAFWDGNLASLNGFEHNFNVASEGATVYVASHDSERGGVGDSLSQWSGNNQYQLGNIFMLAYPYGTPTILSSYKYANKDDGPPSGGSGTCSGNGGANNFNCEHRWPAVTAMVGFRSTCDGQSLQNWQTSGNDRIAFSRGNVGFVAINSNGGAWSQTLTTGLPNGSYCDLLSGGKVNGQCAGTVINVQNNVASINVPARWAIAFSTASKIN